MRDHVKRLLVILFYLALWQIIAIIVNNPLIVADPYHVLLAMGNLVITRDFWQVIGNTSLHLLIGYFFAVLLGTLAAFAAYFHSLFRTLIDPLMKLCQAVPVACFVIFLLIFLGSGRISPFVSFMVGLPILYNNVLSGLQQTDQKMLEMAKVFHMKWYYQLYYIYLLPMKQSLGNTLGMAAGMCLRAGIAAEVIGVVAGTIGEQIYLSKIYLKTDQLFAWTIWILLLSYCFEKIIERIFYGKSTDTEESHPSLPT